MRKQILLLLATYLIGIIANGQIYGVDISHYNNQAGTISWSTIYAAGKSFAYVKATEGVNTNDAYFTTNMTSSNPNGVVRGAYHLGRPDFSTTNTAANEANHFIAIAGSYIGNGFLPPALDMEQTYVNSYISQGNSYTQLAQWINTWCTLIYNAGGKWPVLYTSKCAAATLYPYYQNGTINANIRLWIATANITTDPPGNPGTTACSASWAGWPWVFHQYFAPATAGTNPATYANPGMDQDIFNGNQTAFNNLVNAVSPTATITGFSISPTTVSACNNCFTITFNITASSAMTIMLGASIRQTGGSTFISDPGNDVKINIPAGSSSQTRTFCLPAGTGVGSYDVVTAIWRDDNSNNQIDAGDAQLSTTTTNSILTINSGSPAQPSSVSGNTSVCQGSTQTYSVTAVSGMSYIWTLPSGWTGSSTSNSITVTPGASSGSITVKATNSCGTSTPSTLNVTAGATVTPTISITQTSCTGTTVSFASNVTNAGSNPVYLWTVTGVGTSSNYTSTSFTVTNASNTTQVQAALTSNASCASPTQVSSNTITTNCVSTALPVIDGVEVFTVMPNPNNGRFNVKLKLAAGKTIQFRVTDAAGKIIYSSQRYHYSGTVIREIVLPQVASGIYNLETIIGRQRMVTRIVVVH